MSQQNRTPNINRRNAVITFLLMILVILLCFCLLGFHYNHAETTGLIYFAFSAGLLGIILVFLFVIANQLLYKDQFTGYGNIGHVLAYIRRLSGQKKLNQYAGLFINIKEMKYINQRYGLENGDYVIVYIAQFLDNFFKDHLGATGRLGGDNYYAILQKKDLDEFLRYLNYIIVPVILEGEERGVPVKCRVGINDIKDNKFGRNVLFFSSIALNYAKENLQDRVYFEPYMLEDFTHTKKIVSDTRIGLKNSEFIPYYQPKVDAKTGKLIGCEALVRWSKNGNLIPPEDFIPVLEKNRLITEVDFFVFERVCKDINSWIAKGIEPVTISTNFSKLHLQDVNFIKHIIEIKDKYGIDGKYLEVELTETSDIGEYELIRDFAKQIREAGMHISIDDFGTGYSSLSLLQSIPVDVVKMDKSFLDNCFNDGSKQFIIDVMNIIKHQKEAILFEGVETREQFDFLQSNGCDYIQGYYFDKPLYYVDFEKRLLHPQYTV